MKADDLSRVNAAFFTVNGYVSVLFFLFWAADIYFFGLRAERMQIHIEDRRLRPILEKVQADVRLDSDDGVALFNSPDILAVGYMANLVRERKHGNVTWFNVNRHINPTDVCVASCKLCAFGKHAKDPKAYTWSLDEVWHRAGEGWSEAVTEFHIVGGLHPELTLDWYCEMLRGSEAALPRGSPQGASPWWRSPIWRSAASSRSARRSRS